MTNKELANFIFPNTNLTIDDLRDKYPLRDIEEGVKVTRFAPSPTGFVHIGNFMSALLDYFLAKNSGGIFYLRNEDTDTKREVDSAVEKIFNVLEYGAILPDEYQVGDKTVGNYGPYVQSERKEIYHVFLKHLIEIGRAYPCFATSDELSSMRNLQEKSKSRIGYYGEYAKYRDLSNEERIKRIENGDKFVIRFKSMGDYNKKVYFTDLVNGNIEFPENDLDYVIMKSSDMLPTYHFAHLVDDYLMGTTHVVRGQEWLSSVPFHIELFKTFGFKLPKYVHTSLLLKQEGDIRRKISKRKDPEALMQYYIDKGYPHEAIIESLMTIINSNFEEWRTSNTDKSYLDFPFSFKKMSVSGALYDLDKLDNISKNYISKLKAVDVYNNLVDWSKEYDQVLYNLLNKYKDYSISLFNIEREQKKPRKDYINYSDVINHIWYMYDELYKDFEYEFQKINDKEEIKNILNIYFDKYYDDKDDKDIWFSKIKSLCDELGYASDMKEYKANPENYKGNVADVSTVIRVGVTSLSMTPDLYEILKLLGKERIEKRINMI